MDISAFCSITSRGSDTTTGPGRPVRRNVKRAAHNPRNLLRIVDLDDPFGDAAKESTVVRSPGPLHVPARPG